MKTALTGDSATFDKAQEAELAYLRGETAGTPVVEADRTLEFPDLVEAAGAANDKLMEDPTSPAAIMDSALAYAIHRDAVYGSHHGRVMRAMGNDQSLFAAAKAYVIRKTSGVSVE